MKHSSFDLPQRVEEALLRLHGLNKRSLREWVEGREGKVFLRVTERLGPERQMVPSFELATIDIDEAFQNQGVFSAVLERFEALAEQCQRHVFVESILSPVVLRAVQKRGYQPDLLLGEEAFWKSPAPVLQATPKPSF